MIPQTLYGAALKWISAVYATDQNSLYDTKYVWHVTQQRLHQCRAMPHSNNSIRWQWLSLLIWVTIAANCFSVLFHSPSGGSHTTHQEQATCPVQSCFPGHCHDLPCQGQYTCCHEMKIGMFKAEQVFPDRYRKASSKVLIPKHFCCMPHSIFRH